MTLLDVVNQESYPTVYTQADVEGALWQSFPVSIAHQVIMEYLIKAIQNSGVGQYPPPSNQ